MKDDKPPLLRLNLLAGLILLMGISTYQPVGLETFTKPTTSVSVETVSNDQLVLINNNSIVGLTSPPSNERTLVSLTGIDKLDKIIHCESRGRIKICNQKYGCGAGMGLGQLTRVAIKDCEQHLNRTIDPFVARDNLDCCIWLYETYGTKPWGTATTDWGSWSCWGN